MSIALRALSLYRKSCLANVHLSRNFYVGSVHFASLQKQFDEAKAKLNGLSEDPGNETKLKIYGLFKQATEGAVKTKRPGITDFVGRAKWDAWNSNGDISQEAAQQKYIDLITSLVKSEETTEAARQESGQKYKNLIVEFDGGLRTITLNRPTKFNAITPEMYHEWMAALKEAADDPKTVITAITGNGPYYCSGNDLGSFTNIKPDQIPQLAEDSRILLKNFVNTFIDYPKPLVAVINGPAVGISVTVLALFDGVYATDKATFTTPFSAVGQSPEGCSSVLFPRLMGYGKATQLLSFNKKITADEACQLGLVTEVFPDATFQSVIWPRLKEFSKLPAKCLLYSKQLMRERERDFLHQVNEAECERLKERWQSEDLKNAVASFFSRKKK